MARRIVAEFDAVTGPFLQKLNRIDSSINRFERGTLTSFNRVERGVNSLVGAASRLRTFTGLFATGFGVNLGAQFFDQAKLIRNALREAGDTSEETFNKVFQSSVRALAGFRETAAGVQRFQKALGDTQTIDQSIRQLETLNKLLALSGKTQQERSSTFIQFSQALQAGYLGGEELRAVRENAPIELTREIARVAGGTIADLKDLSKAGLLTTEVMVEALRNLEEEADKRFSAIEVTIQDASKVFTSGAIIAAEAFDEGLGASDATVAGLKNLGTILGENAEAFETFGSAVKVAGALLITSFAGRQISQVIGSFRSLKTARLEAAAAAEAEFAAAKRAQQAAQASLSTRATTLATLTAQGAAAKKVEAAQKSQTNAARRLTAANRRLATAYSVVTVAQNRLLLSQRALAASAAVLRGAFAFLGGIPGLLLAAGTAFFVIRDRMNQTRQSQEALLKVSKDYIDTVDSLVERRRDLARLLSDLGESNLGGAQALVKSLQTEIASLKNSLEDTRRAEADRQRERIALREEEKQRLDELLALEERLRQELAKPLSDFQQYRGGPQPDGSPGIPVFSEGELRQIKADELKTTRSVLNQTVTAIAGVRDAYETVDVAIKEARESLLALSIAIMDSGDEAAPSITRFEKALEDANEAIEENLAETEKLEAEIARLEEVYNTLQQTTGSTSTVSERLQAVIDSLREKLASAKAEARGLTGEMERLTDVLRKANSSQLDNAEQLALVERQLAAARAGATKAQVEAISEVAGLDANRDALIAAGLPVAEFELMRATAVSTAAELAVATEELNAFLNPKAAGSGSSGVTALEEAAAVIERMMTDQERMKRDIAEAEKLRRRLAAGTEIERQAAEKLAQAIARMKEELELADDQLDVFFDSMAQNLANAITDWTNFGDVVRGILADLVREYGPDFFRAILTPGKQSGGSAGTDLGNLVAGLFHDGGRSGRRRNVSAAAFIGAPRFHKGFMPDEFPAILQKGEAVIPKNLVGGMGGGATFIFQNDFSNADPTMKPWIEAQLAEQRAQFESRWIQTARKVNMSRVKV